MRLTDIPKPRSDSVRLTADHLPLGTRNVNDALISEEHQGTRLHILRRAADIEANVIAIRVHLQIIAAVDETDVQVHGVPGFRSEGAVLRHERDTEEAICDLQGYIDSDLMLAVSKQTSLRFASVLTWAVKAGMRTGK